MIVIAQRASTCKDADAVVVLEEGRIAAYGTHEELLAGSSLYAAIFASAGAAAPLPAAAGGDGDGHLTPSAAHALRKAPR